MKKASKKSGDGTQGTLPQLKFQIGETGGKPTEFTSGDAFFNPNTISGFPNNSQLSETIIQAPHPLLNSKITKAPATHTISQPVPTATPPPQVIVPPRLVPPPPPVTFSPALPPILSPSYARTMSKSQESSQLNLESIGDEYSEPKSNLYLEEKMASKIPSPPVASGIPTTRNGENHPVSPTKPTNQICQMFKQAKGIVELPLTLADTDLCGSLCVPVEEGHCVILLVLAKRVETGPAEVKITTDGIRMEGYDTPPATLQAEVAGITNSAANLQGDIAKDGPLIGQIAAFLSSANLAILNPRAKIEAVRGPRGAILGYFQGESLVQFVVTLALMADGPVTHYLDLPFPAILGGGVETYVLPSTADVGDFVRYLTAKNSVGWRGQKTRMVRHRILEQQNTLGRTLIWGGSAVIAYAFAAGLLGAFLPDLALSLSLLAPAILGSVLVGTTQLWRKARRDMVALNLTLANRTSWRLVNFARDQVDRTVVQLQGAYKRQFMGEMCPQDALDTITKLGKTPSPELLHNPRLHEEITAAASYVLGSRAGADDQQLMDALHHAIAEVKQKRLGGAAKLVIAVTRARVQAIVVKVGKVSSKEMTLTMPLDDCVSASLARAKFPIPTSISVPLLDLERDIASGVPSTRERMTKAIAAATALVERTRHFWTGDKPDHVKEVPYAKTSVPVVGEDFDNAFG